MKIVDKSLNYGRSAIESFLRRISPVENVLDIGAGSGQDLEAVRRCSPGAMLYAVESYPPNVEKLRQGKIEVLQANIEREALLFPDEFFDVVMSNQTLEHVKEFFWILHNMSRTLKVGGHLIIGVPNLAAAHNRLLLLAGRQPTCLRNASAHVRGYTKSDFLNSLQKVFPGGYKLEGFAGANFYPFPPFLAKPLAALAPNHAWGIFMLLGKTRPYGKEFLEYPVSERLETNYYLGEDDHGTEHIV
jgi:methionine biosynthesis protein MetW